MTNPRVNSQFVIATLAEFVRVWDLGEDASLHLETTKGQATMAFHCKLGPPSAPHPIPTFPTPPSPPWKPRHHRGPAQREKNRQRAARYQASPVSAPATTVITSSTSASPVPVVSSATPSADSAVVPASVIPLTAEGYGSVRADPAVAPSVDMWFNESCKVYGFIFAIVPRVKGLSGSKLQCV